MTTRPQMDASRRRCCRFTLQGICLQATDTSNHNEDSLRIARHVLQTPRKTGYL